MVKPVFLIGTVAVVAAAIGGGVAYSLNQATYVPTEYQPLTADVLNQQVASASELLSQRVVATDGQVQVVLTATDLNQIMMAAIAEEPSVTPLLDAATGITTAIEDNRIESGMIVTLADIPMEALPPQGQQALGQFTEAFPLLATREMYVAIAGNPQIEAGQVRLGDDTVVKIGRLTLPLNQLASQVGLSQSDLEQHLSALLTQNGITLDSLQLTDGQVIIQATTP